MSSRRIGHAEIAFGQIRPILNAVRQSGVEVDRLLALQGFSDGLDEIDDQSPLDIIDYFRFQRAIAIAFDDLTAQLSDRKLTLRTGHYVISQLQQASNLHEAMVSLVDHFNMMHGDVYNSVRVHGDRVSLIIDDSTFPYKFRADDELVHFIGDCLVIKIHCLLDSLSEGASGKALRRVRLQRERSGELGGQTQFWSVPIDFGWSTYELVYDFDSICRPFNLSHPVDLSPEGLIERVISYLDARAPDPDARSMTARTLEVIESGCIKQADVAQRFKMSVATHRRRLDEEGSCFRDLVLDVRLRRAEALLKRGRSISQIAEELDYSDIRAFNRAFKKWKGLTPAAFAKAERALL